VIHNYVLWRLVMNIMPHMIDEYQQKRVEFRKILLGILSERNRWSQCVEWTNKKLGMAVGALFIRDNFNHDSKVGAPAYPCRVEQLRRRIRSFRRSQQAKPHILYNMIPATAKFEIGCQGLVAEHLNPHG
jgi:predicted metalloendopeptidase